jgi:glycosyltransferase involved in cell wall biosynthesis
MQRPAGSVVSLCMIVRNEAHQLADCLSPLAHLFDDIVIVDTGSEDGTSAVARRFTANVHRFAWCDDFSAARNESLLHARGDWIFWLDADDRLSPANVHRLANILNNLPSHPAIFAMDTVCMAPNRDEPETALSHTRLFRRHPALKWRGRVHEHLDPCPSKLGHKAILSDVRIDHLGYRDATLQRRKLHRDMRLLRMDYAVNPEDACTLLHLGLGYWQLGNAAEARKFLLRLLAGDDVPKGYLLRGYSVFGALSLWERRFQDVVETMERALAIFPRNQHLMYLQAEALYELGRYDASRGVLMRILTGTPNAEFHAGAPDHIKRQLAPRSLGEVLRIQGEFTAAEEVLIGVIREFPHDAAAWHLLGRVYIDMGNRQKLEGVRQALAGCPSGLTFSLLLLAGWGINHGDLQTAGEAIGAALQIAPDLPFARLVKARWLLRSGAPINKCLGAYKDVLRVSPSHPDAVSMVEQLQQQLSAAKPPSPTDWCTTVMVGTGVS